MNGSQPQPAASGYPPSNRMTAPPPQWGMAASQAVAMNGPQPTGHFAPTSFALRPHLGAPPMVNTASATPSAFGASQNNFLPPPRQSNPPQGFPGSHGNVTAPPPSNYSATSNSNSAPPMTSGFVPQGNSHNAPPVMVPSLPHMGFNDHPAPGALESPRLGTSQTNTMHRVSSTSELLPAPYHGQGIYSHPTHVGPLISQNITPTNSEPPSRNSSRVPSPVPSQQFDALEGQFRTDTPTGARDTPPLRNSPVSSPMRPPSSPFNSGQSQTPPPAWSGPAIAQPLGPPLQPLRPPLQPSVAPSSHGGGYAGSQQSFASPYQSVMSVPPPISSGRPPSSTMGGPPLQTYQYGPPPPSHQGGPQPVYQPSGPRPPLPGTSQAPQGYPGGPPGQTLPVPSPGDPYGSMANQFNGMSFAPQVSAETRPLNILQERSTFPVEGLKPPTPKLSEALSRSNCSPDIFRCTLTSLPQTSQLLTKARLPLGILIHPFKDLSHLPVIQSAVIVRCRSCRTYINPFVAFIDQRRWRCNICFRANELPEEFNFDPVSKSYGSPERRPEIKSATIEFVAPSEYMLRPPQPAVYLYLLDVSYNAIQSGYLQSFCEVFLEELDRLPGDSRTLIGFISYKSDIQFYNLSATLSVPQVLVVSDIDDVFLPCPDGLLVSLQESKELVKQLLEKLPTMFEDDFRDDSSAMGAALQAAIKLMSATGGRVTVMQATLPSVGPGVLKSREDPNQRASQKPEHMQPATDFYKRMSLDAAGQQIAIDLFLLSGQYVDQATLGGAARHSGGCLYNYPGLHTMHNPAEVERYEEDLRRYLTRKIGFEAVMRVRCTKGLAVHTFHGNFFVRSTDLLSLPNINPDAGFGMQVSIEESLVESPTASFQAALLYTSSKGERRIRVHTLCIPITTSISEVINGADQEAIVCLLAKMAVDRSITSAVADAREALVNAVVDAYGAYGSTLTSQQRVGTLPVPYSLRMFALLVNALLKSSAFRLGVSTRADERMHAMDQCKSLPIFRLIKFIHPVLYPVHALTDDGALSKNDLVIPQPPILSLCSGNIDRHGAFLLDNGEFFFLWIGGSISPQFCEDVFGKPNFPSLPEGLYDLPELDTDSSERLRLFIGHLQESRANHCPLVIIKDDSRNRMTFMQYMVEDKMESGLSYYEFLQHLEKQLKG